jgi:hypothetical protein
MAQWQSQDTIGADLYAADSDQEFTLGTIVTAEDTSSEELGSADFMYVQADEAIDATEAVTIDQADFNANLAAANGIGPFGVAVADLADTEYGWVQISGKAEVSVASGFAAGNTVYLTATGGTVDDAVVSGDIVYGSLSLSAIDTPNTGTAYIGINRSFTQDA